MTLPDPPHDYMEPEWGVFHKVHGWRNYISDELRALWPTMAPEIRAAVARQAQSIADREEWE